MIGGYFFKLSENSATIFVTGAMTHDIPWYNSWVLAPVTKIVDEFLESLKKYPPIKLGTPDPYSPPR